MVNPADLLDPCFFALLAIICNRGHSRMLKCALVDGEIHGEQTDLKTVNW